MIRAPASAAFNLVKQQKVKNQTVSKKVQSQGAQISKSEAYTFTPQRLRDAAQRRDWASKELG
jgi:hypothetical protein